MNNVNPPSRFTACILLYTDTQQRSQSSAQSGFRISVSMADKGRGGAWKAPPRSGRLSSLALVLAAGLLEIVDDRGIGEGCDISKVVLALGHAAEDAAHDLAAPRLRQIGGEDDLLGPRVRPYGLPDRIVELLDELFASFLVAFEDHVGHDSLALVLVVPPDNGGLGHALVGDERALDLHRADAVPRDVHHVVYPAGDGVVTILIPLGAVLDEILVAEPLPVGLTETLGVLVDRP